MAEQPGLTYEAFLILAEQQGLAMDKAHLQELFGEVEAMFQRIALLRSVDYRPDAPLASPEAVFRGIDESMEDLTRLTVAQLAQRIRSKEVSPVEVADAFLRRIEAVEPRLNAFITRLDDYARRAAATAEAEIMAGEYRGPFHGIPIGLKDLFWTKDIRTTSGSLLDADFVPAEDSAVASRLMAAGAYCVGKLHMTEFAFDGTSRNHHYGPARNPWDTARMAGGSSSGSGVAVASGEAPIAVGTDTGGSVRVPAALCGITGLKPTYGLISRFGVTPLSWSMDHVGPLARTVEDAALALNVLAGHDPRDRASVDATTQDYTLDPDRGVKGMRIGVPREYVWDMVDQEVHIAFDEAVAVMESLGADVQEVSIADLELINPAGSVVQTAEAATIHRSRLLASGDRYDPVIRRRFESGLFVPAEAYLTASTGEGQVQTEHPGHLGAGRSAGRTHHVHCCALNRTGARCHRQAGGLNKGGVAADHADLQRGGTACHLDPMRLHGGAPANRIAVGGQAAGGFDSPPGSQLVPDGDSLASGAA